MAIHINADKRVFTLQTAHSTYQCKADEHGFLLHTYYGRKTDDTDMSYLFLYADRGFCANPHEIGGHDRTYSLDALPQEEPVFGAGDYRTPALRVKNPDGSQICELRYAGYETIKGKYNIPGLPHVRDDENSTGAETLMIKLYDTYSGLEADLFYGIFEKLDVITRAVHFRNTGNKQLVLEKAASMALDFQDDNFDLVSFFGRHEGERTLQREKLGHGVKSIGSTRGASSHQYNPFAILSRPDTNETEGECYGFGFVYSGDFIMEADVDQLNQTRFVCGIHPDEFEWTLESGAEFWTPEIVCAYSSEGFETLSKSFHKIISENIIRGKWRDAVRPVLINSWEGA
jgi:alpha-galactosidase